VAKAGLSGAYGAEWETLHPSYRRAVSRARFIACERRSASAIGLIKVTSVVAEGTQVITTTLPLLGDVDVYDVTLLVTYNQGRMRNNMAEIDLFWVLHEGKWVRVFAPAAYAAYMAGKCP
jgi:hypothetical protein